MYFVMLLLWFLTFYVSSSKNFKFLALASENMMCWVEFVKNILFPCCQARCHGQFLAVTHSFCHRICFTPHPHHQGINLIQSTLPSKMFSFHKRFSPRIGDLDKKKYLVPSDLTVGQFYFLIRFNNSLWKELSWIVSWISSLIYQEENQPEAGGRPLLLRQQHLPAHLRHHGSPLPGILDMLNMRDFLMQCKMFKYRVSAG